MTAPDPFRPSHLIATSFVVHLMDKVFFLNIKYILFRHIITLHVREATCHQYNHMSAEQILDSTSFIYHNSLSVHVGHRHMQS